MVSTDLQTHMVSLSEIVPYAGNAKEHPEWQVDQLVSSIEKFGNCDPIGVWHNQRGQLEVVEGHGRLMALEKLGYEEAPVIFLDHLTDEQRRAYTLVHNKLTMNTDFDTDLLEMELDAIADIDMSEFGFDIEVDDVAFDDNDGDVEQDDVPDNAPSIVKSGDIWQLGRHRLMCGDSTDPAAIDRLMDGVKADMVFTDPPYGMNLDTDFSSMQNHLDFAKEKGFTGGKKYEQGKVDEFHPEMIDAVLAIDADEMFLWGADYFAELLPNKNDGSWIVWDKRANGNDDVAEDYSSDKMYGSCFELCWSKKKHKRDIARVKWAGVFGTEQEFDHKRYHPTQKPIKLAGWFLNRYSKEKQVVVDLFGGSGCTLIACEQLNRTCYMMELDPHYCDVIIERWQNLTGETARKVESDG